MLTKKKRVFFDYASGTPIDSSVYKSMIPYFRYHFHNPSSLYKEAINVKKDIDCAREGIAKILGAREREILFVDGATEANNLFILGTLEYWKSKNPHKIPHIITSYIEHPSILNVCKELEKSKRAEVTYLEVDKYGRVRTQDLKNSLMETTILVSIAYVNGEIGVIQDIKDLVKTVRLYKKKQGTEYPYFHTDAVQAIPYIDNIQVTSLGVDGMTINASKIYGPKKIACLYIASDSNIKPLFFGGSQEKSYRPGTENVPAIIGLYKALVRVRSRQKKELERLFNIQKKIRLMLFELCPSIIFNTPEHYSSPHILNISFPNISHEELVLRLDAEGVLCSAKAACASGQEGDSHVIIALRKNTQLTTGSLRISLGYHTKYTDIKFLKKALQRSLLLINKEY